jgi:hypothetical protein
VLKEVASRKKIAKPVDLVDEISPTCQETPASGLDTAKNAYSTTATPCIWTNSMHGWISC